MWSSVTVIPRVIFALSVGGGGLLSWGAAYAGILDQPPDRFKVISLFTGVRTDALIDIAVTVHCTNIHRRDVTLRVEFFASHGGLVGSEEISLPQGETRTLSAGLSGGDTLLYDEDALVLLSEDLNQGSLRILTSSDRIICSAHVLHQLVAQPESVVPLTPFSFDLTRPRRLPFWPKPNVRDTEGSKLPDQ